MVTVTFGNQSYMHELVDIYAEGALKIDDLAVAAGVFREVVFYVTVADGQLSLRFVDSGGVDFNWVIAALTVQPGSPPALPTAASFDFGAVDSLVEAGYTQVTETTLYSSSIGYGWTSTAGLSSRDRGAPDDLRRDLVQSTAEHAFSADLANGNYQVTVVIGDQSYLHDLIDIYAEGVLRIDDMTTFADAFQQAAFPVTVADQQLNLRILDGGGSDGNWVINSLTIQPVS